MPPDFPSVEASDLAVLQTNFLAAEQFKAYSQSFSSLSSYGNSKKGISLSRFEQPMTTHFESGAGYNTMHMLYTGQYGGWRVFT